MYVSSQHSRQAVLTDLLNILLGQPRSGIDQRVLLVDDDSADESAVLYYSVGSLLEFFLNWWLAYLFSFE